MKLIKSKKLRSLFSALGLAGITSFLLFFGLHSVVQANFSGPEAIDVNSFEETYSLLTGQGFGRAIEMTESEQVIFSVEVTGGANLDVTFIDPSLATIKALTVRPGEKIFGSVTLVTGTNTINFANAGGGTNQFTIFVDNLPSPPASFDGIGETVGVTSTSAIDFDQSGFYTFTFGIGAGDTYTYELGTIFNRVVTEAITVVEYIPSGIHPFAVIQQTGAAGTFTEWSVDVSLEGLSAQLPYDLSETIATNTREIFPLNDPTSVNILLEVGGSGSSLDFAVVDDGNNLLAESQISADVGENVYATVDLPAGANELIFTPTGSINYNLTIESVPSPTALFSGISAGAGQTSTARINFPSTGLYTFNFNEAAGGYRFILEESPLTHIEKVITGSLQATLFVPAGIHPFYIDQDSGSGATWSVNVALDQNSDTEFPFAYQSAVLGGPGNEFDSEIMPVSVDTGIQTNLNITVSGTSGDFIVIELLDSLGSVQETISPINVDESLWTTLQLTSGINYLRVTADSGNAAGASYSFNMESIPSAATTLDWGGEATVSGLPSTYTIDLPSSGLYQFDATVNSGSYQIEVPSGTQPNIVLKTIDATETFTMHLPAGRSPIVVHKDTTTGADWRIGLSPSGIANDSLPYNQSGGDLSPTGFMTDWLTIHPATPQWANIILTPTGASANGLEVTLWDGNTATNTLTTSAYGGETHWTAAEIPQDGRIQLSAEAGNGGPLAYDLLVVEPESIEIGVPNSWEGIGNNSGEASTILVNAAYSGTYRITTTLGSGSATFEIGPLASSTPGTVITQPTDDVALPNGLHLITITQSLVDPLTDWRIELFIDEVITPTIINADPMTLTVGVTTETTINGVNFYTPTISMIGMGMTYSLSADQFGPSTATVLISNTIPAGEYDLILTNIDGKSTSKTDAIVIVGPEITSISPASVREGESTAVEIAGTNLFDPRVYLTLDGTDYLIETESSTDKEIEANVPNTLALGIYDLYIINGSLTADASNVLTDVFEVLPPLSPILNSVSPDAMLVNQSDLLILSGADFVDPSAFLVREGVTTTLSIFAFTTDTITTVVPLGLDTGAYDVFVKNGTPTAPRSNILSEAFEIVLNLIPAVSGVSPFQVEIDTAMEITITGSSFDDPTVYIVLGANEIEITPDQFSTSQIQATLPSTVTLGTYSLYVQNGNGFNSSLVTNAFQVVEMALDSTIYLPFVGPSFVALPDLIVSQFSATQSSVTIEVQNVGGKAVVDEFWVDLYINPNTPPTSVNQTIQTLESDGMVWLIPAEALPIGPGESLTLTLNDSYYQESSSRFDGTIASGSNLYVQVDSANVDSNYGGVLEYHEETGREYNNIESIVLEE